MGCIWSGHGSRASLYRVEADTGDQGSSTVFSWDKLERPDAKDFVFRDINEDIRVKPQGLFLRDCQSCVVIAACHQFRTRDCCACSCMLLCGTKPIIESSSKMQLGCFDTGYHGLTAQLQAIGLSKFRNFWSDVHDFTPNPESWSFLSKELSSMDLLKPIPETVTEHLTLDLSEAIPQTQGKRPLTSSQEDFLVVLFPSAEDKIASDLVHQVADQVHDVVLLRTNEFKMSPEAMAELHKTCKLDTCATVRPQTDAYIGLEFQGTGCNVVEALAAATECVILKSRLQQDAQQLRFAGLA